MCTVHILVLSYMLLTHQSTGSTHKAEASCKQSYKQHTHTRLEDMCTALVHIVCIAGEFINRAQDYERHIYMCINIGSIYYHYKVCLYVCIWIQTCQLIANTYAHTLHATPTYKHTPNTHTYIPRKMPPHMVHNTLHCPAD